MDPSQQLARLYQAGFDVQTFERFPRSVAVVRDYARKRSLPLGAAVSELVRSGLTTPKPTRIVNGFHIVDLPADSPAVTTEDVRRLEDELP